MAVPRALGIKINKLTILIDELTKRVAALEYKNASLRLEVTALNSEVGMKEPKSATKRRRTKKAA